MPDETIPGAPLPGEPVTAAAPTSAEPADDASAVPSSPAPAVLDAVPPVFDADEEWRRVSPKYVVVEVVGSIVGALVGIAVLAGLALFAHWTFAWWIAGAVAAISIVSIVLEPRRVRAIGYRLRHDDLLFRRGIMVQRQVAVPYGRMQLVDITRSPVARWLGLAELKFVTAAAATSVVLPGLPAADAEALRDELVALAETRRAGL